MMQNWNAIPLSFWIFRVYYEYTEWNCGNTIGSMAEKESINGRRTAMDEKDFELLRILDETRNITHAAD